MSTEKQIIANKENAMYSTGPKTIEGKAIVATNPTKHGIFTKDLIISTVLGKENEEEYTEMLNNLIDCLSPRNQMESLLVEKIAIDFWRLRRVIRFETGSIGQYLETIFKEFYSYPRKPNVEIEKEIVEQKQYITWILSYLEYLKKEEVDFDYPIWSGETLESNIIEDFRLIVKNLNQLPCQERERLVYGNCSYDELKMVLFKSGFSSKKEISTKLIDIYEAEKHRSEKQLVELQEKQKSNMESDKLNTRLGIIPKGENIDKVLKYERSIQKSIFQNLILLKKLQGVF